jgi:hypothetical protein
MTDRKKPGVAFWATVLMVAVLVGYPLSFGPACWIATRTHTDDAKLFAVVYGPMWWAIRREVPVAGDIFGMYAIIGMRPGSSLQIPSDGRRLDVGESEITEISRN